MVMNVVLLEINLCEMKIFFKIDYLE